MYYFILFFACFCGATSSVFVKFTDAPSVVVLVYRLAFTLLIMLPYTLVFQRSQIKNLNTRLVLKTMLSGVCFAAHLLTFFEALRFTGVAEAAILVAMEVLFIALFELIIWHKGISSKGWVFLLLSCVAAYFVISGGKQSGYDESYPNYILGNGLAIISAILSGFYTLLGRDVRKHVSMPVYTSLLYTSSLIVSLIYIAVYSIPLFEYNSKNYIWGIALAIVPTIFGHNLFSFSLKHFKSSMVSSAKLTSPVFSTVLAWIIFGAVPSLQVIIASLVMIFTIYKYIQVEKDKN